MAHVRWLVITAIVYQLFATIPYGGRACSDIVCMTYTLFFLSKAQTTLTIVICCIAVAGELRELSRHLPYHCSECAELARAARSEAAGSAGVDDPAVVPAPRPSTPKATAVTAAKSLEVRSIFVDGCRCETDCTDHQYMMQHCSACRLKTCAGVKTRYHCTHAFVRPSAVCTE